MYNYARQFLAIFLCITMLAQILPQRVFADEVVPTADVTASDDLYEAEVLGEDISRRTETEKHFRMSDGSFYAVKYGAPVHYQNAQGEWIDIDNSLDRIDTDVSVMGTGSDAVTSGYVNRANRVEVKFAESLNDGVIYQYSLGRLEQL